MDLTPAGDISLRVGVIDTGIVLRDEVPHEFLRERVCFEPEDTARVVYDEHGNPAGSAAHGSFVAGVVLKQVPPEVGVRMKGAIDEESGDVEDLAVANAIDALNAEGITLINLSFSGATWEDKPPKAIEDALRRLPQHAVVVASAGNRGTRQRVYPAGFKLAATVGGRPDEDHVKVVAVGSVDTSHDPAKPPVADFSNFGPWISAYANGVDVTGPYFWPGCPAQRHSDEPDFNGYAVWSGTSFSAAIVTGQIAAKMHETRVSARAAADALLNDAEKICVWDVNGKLERPFVRGVPEPGE
ncbi:S8/S53 family peptidase [Amycolatopsis sp. Hca4]|uniref:S8 family peptidase n=1 Tax=Amycolatopsis sp. Hca4 TaxID=2742131 RepID=UPI0020CB1DF9|nr:S8/S53 family peptidase [Amycolatopsis sp. Hca4]